MEVLKTRQDKTYDQIKAPIYYYRHIILCFKHRYVFTYYLLAYYHPVFLVARVILMFAGWLIDMMMVTDICVQSLAQMCDESIEHLLVEH